MKNGILTFHFAHNYGAVLQAYALQTYLKKQNVEYEIINYVSDKLYADYNFIPTDLLFRPRKTIDFLRNYKNKQSINNVFRKFSDRYLQISDECGNLAMYDNLIIGSDQVWNKEITGFDKIYMGATAKGSLYSYAASCGKRVDSTVIDDNDLTLLKSFKHISCREANLTNFLHENDLTATTVCDPVFLLNKDEWKKISNMYDFVFDNYVLIYALEYNEDILKFAEQLKTKNNYRVFVIHPLEENVFGSFDLLKNIGPSEFIYLIENCKILLTNSFHGLAFGLIFNKLVYLASHSTLNERIEHLLSALDIMYDTIGNLKCISSVSSDSISLYRRNGEKFIEQYILPYDKK